MKSLLVHLDGTARCAARLQLAESLARQHAAHLTALFATTPPLLDTAYAYAAEASMLQVLRDRYIGWRAQAVATFHASTTAAGTAWAELGVEPVVAGFARQALGADLLVLGQHDPDDREPEVPADFLPSVLIASGRPALLLPCIGDPAPTSLDAPAHAVIAWKPTPQAARALGAAMPLLRRAQRVTVLAWGEAPGTEVPDALGPLRYLELHGVMAALVRDPVVPTRLGEGLLSRVADLCADLLVMGCYGHSRAREFILGGATRTVLSSMTVPVLTSH